MTRPAFYITTPIYYVNDVPHIGHIYTTVACDVLARFKRLDGHEVFFLTGTDEHGQKVHRAAQAAGVDPQAFTDKVSQNFRDILPVMTITNDDFIRTTETRHKAACAQLWNKMTENGDIYLDKYAGWYAVRDEAFYAEDELTPGPDGKKIAPSGAECAWVEEESYFFRLSNWGERLLEFYEKNRDFILPESRRNEVLSFVKSGLRDLSISRTNFPWGVPVPGDERHVMYVWVDALTNYITALGYPDENAEKFRKFWPADVHMVGKDILRFHAVYWPAFLMSAGLEPPRHVFAHGWWTIEGQKMSKSLGNAISPHDLVARYGVDATRYALLREVPFGNDGDFSHAAVTHRINADLANGLGNLAQRTLAQIAKNCGGAVPACGSLTPEDRGLLDHARIRALPAVRAELDAVRLHKALEAIWDIVNAANVYIDAQAPWALKKTDTARMETVLYVLAETIRCIALLAQPVVPEGAGRILDQLGVPATARDFAHLDPTHALTPGAPLPAPQGVFPRIETDEKKAAGA
jgi:methionyl-tRNA synthetase